MNSPFFYLGLFLIFLFIIDGVGQSYYKDFPQKYYFRIISAAVYIILSSCYTFIFVPAVFRLSLYELYIRPDDRLMYLVPVIWFIIAALYTVKLFVNIKKLLRGI